MWRLALYVVALYAGWMIAGGLLYPLAAGVARGAGVRPELSAWLTLFAAAFATVLLVRRVERRPWADVGLDDRAARPGLLLRGAALGALPILLPSLVLLAAGVLRAQPAPDPTPAAWVDGALRTLWVLVPAALFEELLVRGYPLLVLRESAGTVVALVATSLVFGLLHAQNPGATVASVLVVSLAGIFLGAVRLATGSLWAAFSAHLAWNFVLSGVLHAAVSGTAFPTPGYRVVDAGPDWLTGGAWGPEGGVPAAAGMLTVLWWLQRGRGARRALAATTTA
ncbi:MAG TPA: type II CAAX endopeptidase family protein [Gemmatirosa sp.]|nr:type II CAAX endopeptidase family protein [Gemmatirosa sp.]